MAVQWPRKSISQSGSPRSRGELPPASGAGGRRLRRSRSRASRAAGEPADLVGLPVVDDLAEMADAGIRQPTELVRAGRRERDDRRPKISRIRRDIDESGGFARAHATGHLGKVELLALGDRRRVDAVVVGDDPKQAEAAGVRRLAADPIELALDRCEGLDHREQFVVSGRHSASVQVGGVKKIGCATHATISSRASTHPHRTEPGPAKKLRPAARRLADRDRSRVRVRAGGVSAGRRRDARTRGR